MLCPSWGWMIFPKLTTGEYIFLEKDIFEKQIKKKNEYLKKGCG